MTTAPTKWITHLLTFDSVRPLVTFVGDPERLIYWDALPILADWAGVEMDDIDFQEGDDGLDCFVIDGERVAYFERERAA